MDYRYTEFDFDSSSRLPFRRRTDQQTDKQTNRQTQLNVLVASVYLFVSWSFAVSRTDTDHAASVAIAIVAIVAIGRIFSTGAYCCDAV